jgi:hypothetical protein
MISRNLPTAFCYDTVSNNALESALFDLISTFRALFYVNICRRASKIDPGQFSVHANNTQALISHQVEQRLESWEDEKNRTYILQTEERTILPALEKAMRPIADSGYERKNFLSTRTQ